MKIGDLILIQENDSVYGNTKQIGGMIVEYNAYSRHIGEYIIEWFDGQRTTEYDEEVQKYRNYFLEVYGNKTKGNK